MVSFQVFSTQTLYITKNSITLLFRKVNNDFERYCFIFVLFYIFEGMFSNPNKDKLEITNILSNILTTHTSFIQIIQTLQKILNNFIDFTFNLIKIISIQMHLNLTNIIQQKT